MFLYVKQSETKYEITNTIGNCGEIQSLLNEWRIALNFVKLYWNYFLAEMRTNLITYFEFILSNWEIFNVIMK